MDSASDRANRASWQQFSLMTVLIMFGIGITTNLVTITLIAFAGPSITLPITVVVVLVNLLTAAGTIDGIGDWETIISDYDKDEEKTHFAQRISKTPTIFFKSLMALIFGGLALSQLYVIYIV